jgi:hypothetical protein
MATAPEPFTNCHYCELRAATKHRSLVRDRRSGRRRAWHIYACFLHKEEAERDARLGLAP